MTVYFVVSGQRVTPLTVLKSAAVICDSIRKCVLTRVHSSRLLVLIPANERAHTPTNQRYASGSDSAGQILYLTHCTGPDAIRNRHNYFNDHFQSLLKGTQFGYKLIFNILYGCFCLHSE